MTSNMVVSGRNRLRARQDDLPFELDCIDYYQQGVMLHPRTAIGPQPLFASASGHILEVTVRPGAWLSPEIAYVNAVGIAYFTLRQFSLTINDEFHPADLDLRPASHRQKWIRNPPPADLWAPPDVEIWLDRDPTGITAPPDAPSPTDPRRIRIAPITTSIHVMRWGLAVGVANGDDILQTSFHVHTIRFSPTVSYAPGQPEPDIDFSGTLLAHLHWRRTPR